jgi:hypothetical protein
MKISQQQYFGMSDLAAMLALAFYESLGFKVMRKDFSRKSE